MKNRHTLSVLVLVFLILAAGIVAVGGLLYRSQQDNRRTEAEHELAAIGNLKVGELSEWRKERLADANLFYKNKAFSDLVRHSIERPQDLSLQEELRDWIGHFQSGHHYDQVTLFDAACNERISIPADKGPLCTTTLENARKAMLSGQVTFADFYPDMKTKKVYLRVFVPILDGPSLGRSLGVLRFRIDPEAYLYPFIQRWPTPSETAETLLVRREGNEVVFLNELRFRKNTALNLRLPLDRTEIPSVKAVLGQEGIAEGIGYDGYPVLAAAYAVPDSPWFLVAKIDLDEVYSPMREKFWLAVIFVSVMLFGAAMAMGFIWRQQQVRFYNDQLKAAESLHKVNANLAITLKSIGDAVISADLAGNILHLNPIAETLTGWTSAEAAGQPLTEVFQIINAQTRQPVANPVASVLKTGQIVGLANHTVLIARGGPEYQIADSAAPIWDGSGTMQGVVLVFRDVTKEYVVAEELRRQETFTRLLLEHQGDGIVACDANMKLVLFNRTAREWHGTDVRDIPPAQWNDHYKLYDAEGILPLSHDAIPLVRAFRGESIQQVSMTIRTKDQEVRYVTASGEAFFDESGNKLGAVVMMRDVTRQRLMEKQLRQHAVELEATNKALEESRHLAEAANRAKSEFLANMSHELRTPLNAVIGFSEGLLERADRHPLNDHQKDRLGKIKASGEHLLQLINGVLDIAKVESGKANVQITTFGIEPVARQVGDLAEALARDKPDVRFILDIEEHLPTITSDCDMIRQVLVNLLSNAIKFTEQGSVSLRIRRSDDSLHLSVEDTGVGIAVKHQGRLFEQFYQVEQKTHRPLKGAGLGLAISKAFAELLGGALTVESVEGHGSTFTLTIPWMFDRRGGGDRRRVAEQASAPSDSAPEGQERFRVLCIEANPASSMLSNDYPTEADQVVHAANGLDGLRLAASEHPQAIVLDAMLPDHEGWGILYHLKDNPATRNIPVILNTGLGEHRLGHLLGANDILVKSVDELQLLQAIRRVPSNLVQGVPNVAIVDDDPSILRLVGSILKEENFDVCTYESGEAFLASLATRQPDVVIVDLSMPHMDGFQVIERLREHPSYANIPVVVMTATVLTEDDFLQLNRSDCTVIQKDGMACKEALRQLIDRLQMLKTPKEKHANHSTC